MRRIINLRTAGWLAVALAALAVSGCGAGASSGTSGSAGPSVSTPATTAVPTPSATASGPDNIVISSTVTYPWHWPNDVNRPAIVKHRYPVPPMPELTAISVGDHVAQAGERHFNRMSFTFTTAFPTYQVANISELTSDPAGQPIPLSGDGVLTVIFRQAQAHTDQGTSSVQSEPPGDLGLSPMVAWAKAGDYEGVLTFGVGIDRVTLHSDSHPAIRVVEVEKVTAQGEHLYVVAIDVDATGPHG